MFIEIQSTNASLFTLRHVLHGVNGVTTVGISLAGSRLNKQIQTAKAVPHAVGSEGLLYCVTS